MVGDFLILQVNTDELRVALARVREGSVELIRPTSFQSENAGSDAQLLRDQVVLDALASHIRANDWASKPLVVVVGSTKVACQYYAMPPLKGSALKQAVLLKLGQQLHFDVADAIVAIDAQGDVSAADDSEKQCWHRVGAIDRDLVDCIIDVAESLSLKLHAVTVAPAALAAHAMTDARGTRGLRVLLYSDERQSTFLLLADGQPRVATDLPIGLTDLTAAMMRPIIVGDHVIQLDEQQAAALRSETGIPEADATIDSIGVTGDRLLPLLEPTLQKFAKHLTQWLSFASTQFSGRIESFSLVGPGAGVPGLADALAVRVAREVEAKHWLDTVATIDGALSCDSIEPCAVMVGAGLHWESTPDLIPPEFKRERRMRRVRRRIAMCGPFLAAGVLLYAFMLDNIHGTLSTTIDTRNAELADVQEIVGRNQQWEGEKRIITQLQGQFDKFSLETPNWVGMFKELSHLLPTEMRATELTANRSTHGLKLVLRASVLQTNRGRGFDEVVGEAMMALEGSVFLDSVQLLSANRDESEGDDLLAGTFAVELELAYPAAGDRT